MQLNLCKLELNIRGIKNYTYGQPDLTIDLANNPELLSKFVKLKGLTKIKANLSNLLAKLQLYFRSPEPLGLNKFQKLSIKVILLCLIMVDWWLSIYAVVILIFHSSLTVQIILSLWLIFPNFFSLFWSLYYQLLYVDNMVNADIDGAFSPN